MEEDKGNTSLVVENTKHFGNSINTVHTHE